MMKPAHERRWALAGASAAAALGLTAMLAASGTAGCAARAEKRPTDATTTQAQPGAHTFRRFGAAYQSLQRQAARAAGVGDSVKASPPGLDPLLETPIPEGTPEGARAREPLAAVLASLGAPDTIEREFPPASLESQEGAVRRYVTGREKMLRGDARGAVEDLRAATRLDPASPEVWRELGEAQLAAGSPSEAVVSMQAAVERGLKEARILEFLGRQAEDRGEFDRAAEWLARADALQPRREDPALPLVIRVELGRCLLKQGRLEAGREALAGALDLPERPPSPTRYPQEVASVYRRQAELWREVGDADCRLGRYERALDAYQRAATLPALEDVDLAPRVFFAASRAGRPAAAAVFVLDRVAANAGFVTRDDRALMAIVSSSDEAVARDLGDALDSFRSTLEPGTSPSVIGSIERARAAIRGGAEGARVLRAHLSRFPGDASAAADLFGMAEDAVAEVSRLTGANPEYADRYADAMARAVPDADGAADALLASGTDAGALAGVYLLARVGRDEHAWERARDMRPAGSLRSEVEVARARLAADAGLWPDGERALAALENARGDDGAWARVRALWAMRRPGPALDALRPLLDRTVEPSLSLERLLFAATLAAATGNGAEAETFVRRCSAMDPLDDRPYGLMLSLYGPGGLAADPEKLSAALRDLRQNVPDSRLSAFLRAHEFLRRSFYRPAERELRKLAAPDPTDGATLELLSTVWTRLGARPDDPDLVAARAWLDEQTRLRPWSDTLAAAKARVLASSGEAPAAEALLRERWLRRPTPEVSRLLEVLLRDSGRGAEADVLAEARLSSPPLSIDEAIERAEHRSRQEKDVDAAEAITTGIPAKVVLEPEQARRILVLAGPIVTRSTDRPESAGAAIRLMDDLVQRRIKLPPEMHDQRLALLAALPEADEERLLAAARDAAREYPQISATAYLSLCRNLEKNERTREALAVIERAASDEQPSIDLLWEWLRLVLEAGGGEEGRRAIDRAAALGQVSGLLTRALPDGPRDPADDREPRGALAFMLAGNASRIGRADAAASLYDLCLEYDPGHPWASNNLGYSLLERGVDLERAERLLTAAHAALPTSSSVLDSIGWLRYKQGALDDEMEAGSGRVTREGAVTLLDRAARTEDGQRNHTILDHYGDALWAAGRRHEARGMWEQASRVADSIRRELRRSRSDAGGDERARENARREVNEVWNATRRKLEAVARGEDPPIAPRAGVPVPDPSGE